jgi:hypothetical protein
MTHQRLALALLLSLSCVSCRSAQRLVKAFPAEPSPFLIHQAELKRTEAAKSPFLLDWKNKDANLWAQAQKRPHIHIAPINLDHLRPMSRPLSKIEVSEKSRQRNVRKLAGYFRQELEKAFRLAPEERREVIDPADKDALVLEVAITEFNPNPIMGGLMRKGINILLWPGAETAVSHKLKGYMAIEGRLRDERTGQVLYEFADAEQNRSGIILYVHDYTTYTYFRKACREWSKQIEEVIRTEAAEAVTDGPPATLLLW